MCGFYGGIFQYQNKDEPGFHKNHLKLLHRGPDQQHVQTEITPQGTVILGQTRLNIVDQKDICLPIRFGNNVILFNGEIYNYQSIRSELSSLGRRFSTRTDTEVVLAAYLEWGPTCLNRFNGMWAIAIWNGTRFFLARDRLGQKPIYYRTAHDRFEFSSEIKAFDNLSYCGNEYFELLEFCYDDHTPYKDVYSLKPGHYYYHDTASLKSQSTCYWELTNNSDKTVTNPVKAVDDLIDLLSDSVRLRTQADVPVTIFLSGGIDSAVIAALSGIDKTFTCQFDEFKEHINEELYATDLASRLGIDTTLIYPKRDEFLSSIPKLANYLEIPTGSFSVFPLYCLAQHAALNGFRVALTGDGSDELFFGYVRNELLYEDSTRSFSEKETQYKSLLSRYYGTDLDRFCRMASRSGPQGAVQLKSLLLQKWNKDSSLIKNTSLIESTIFLQPLLQMSDRMLMANHVEGRCPFLDHRIVEYSRSLADDLLFRDGKGKWIIHKLAEKILPKGSLVLERPIKHGLPTPVNQWLFGTHSFSRTEWNSLLMAECIKQIGS